MNLDKTIIYVYTLELKIIPNLCDRYYKIKIPNSKCDEFINNINPVISMSKYGVLFIGDSIEFETVIQDAYNMYTISDLQQKLIQSPSACVIL